MSSVQHTSRGASSSHQKLPYIISSAVVGARLVNHLTVEHDFGSALINLFERSWGLPGLCAAEAKTVFMGSEKEVSGVHLSGPASPLSPNMDGCLKASTEQALTLSKGFQIHSAEVAKYFRNALIAQAQLGLFQSWMMVLYRSCWLRRSSPALTGETPGNNITMIQDPDLSQVVLPALQRIIASETGARLSSGGCLARSTDDFSLCWKHATPDSLNKALEVVRKARRRQSSVRLRGVLNTAHGDVPFQLLAWLASAACVATSEFALASLSVKAEEWDEASLDDMKKYLELSCTCVLPDLDLVHAKRLTSKVNRKRMQLDQKQCIETQLSGRYMQGHVIGERAGQLASTLKNLRKGKRITSANLDLMEALTSRSSVTVRSPLYVVAELLGSYGHFKTWNGTIQHLLHMASVSIKSAVGKVYREVESALLCEWVCAELPYPGETYFHLLKGSEVTVSPETGPLTGSRLLEEVRKHVNVQPARIQDWVTKLVTRRIERTKDIITALRAFLQTSDLEPEEMPSIIMFRDASVWTGSKLTHDINSYEANVKTTCDSLLSKVAQMDVLLSSTPPSLIGDAQKDFDYAQGLVTSYIGRLQWAWSSDFEVDIDPEEAYGDVRAAGLLNLSKFVRRLDFKKPWMRKQASLILEFLDCIPEHYTSSEDTTMIPSTRIAIECLRMAAVSLERAKRTPAAFECVERNATTTGLRYDDENDSVDLEVLGDGPVAYLSEEEVLEPKEEQKGDSAVAEVTLAQMSSEDMDEVACKSLWKSIIKPSCDRQDRRKLRASWAILRNSNYLAS
eukprot:6454721-Amphidinium_carterae.1